MFANLRQGSQVYILHKTSTPYVEIGTVDTMNNMSVIGYFPNMPMMPIDINVRIGDKVIPFKQLPANAEIANGIAPGGTDEISLACTKETISSEVQQMMQKSIEIINSVNYHKQRIEVCKSLLDQLNPEMAEKKAQQEELSTLRGLVSTLKSEVEGLRKELGSRSSSQSNQKPKQTNEHNDNQNSSH